VCRDYIIEGGVCNETVVFLRDGIKDACVYAFGFLSPIVILVVVNSWILLMATWESVFVDNTLVIGARN
jgi:hypothetical protein